jgi:hypothetical protein
VAAIEKHTKAPWKIKNYHIDPLPGIYLKELTLESGADIQTPMFIAALLIIVTIWNQEKCPSTYD